MRLIDADALLKTLNDEKIPYNSDINYFILNAPTVDAVEVVRCKDCISYHGYSCYTHKIDMGENEFCSCGESGINKKNE